MDGKTKIMSDPWTIGSDLSCLYEILKTNKDTSKRRSAATYLIKLIEKGEDVDCYKIADLFNSEKDITVAAELKRAFNKLKIRETFLEDPTSKYDKKLTPKEEAEIFREIERLRKLYDKSFKEKGLSIRNIGLLKRLLMEEWGKYIRPSEFKIIRQLL